ncbi:MAG: hypothetical protein V7K26_25935 [Nostoc sp.]
MNDGEKKAIAHLQNSKFRDWNTNNRDPRVNDGEKKANFFLKILSL